MAQNILLSITFANTARLTMTEYNHFIKDALIQKIRALEAHFGADCVLYYGVIDPSIEKSFRDFIEALAKDGEKPENAGSRLAVVLNSPGGSVETVEKLVRIIRYHYDEVYFVVPDEAMSAGTIFCMAGDKIYMDYSSSLGPIDPQVFNGKNWVPALGYLDQVEDMIQKSAKGTLTDAELVILENQDLALLSQYEQAKQLAITLLKQWLVSYKFKDWTHHQSDPQKLGKAVTHDEKERRASEIAAALSDNNRWHSHGRKISALTLSEDIRLKIEDYSEDDVLRAKIRAYNDLLVGYLASHRRSIFIHSRLDFSDLDTEF